MNDDTIANRVRVEGATENIYVINASAKFNNDIAIALRGVLNSKMIDLLVDFDTAQDILQKNIPEYNVDESGDIMLFYERPYLETRALINEMVSLEYTKNPQTGVIQLYETGSNTKDRYVSLAYGSYFIGLLEQDLLSDRSEYDYCCIVD